MRITGEQGGALALSIVLFASMLGSLLAAGGLEGFCGAALAALMLAIAVTDARRYIIPNELSGAAAVLALVRAFWIGPDAGTYAVLSACVRAAAIALPLWGMLIAYRRWRGREGLGLGDVKLAAVAGAWLGLTTIFAVIELAALSAIAAYLANAALHRRPLRATAALPFGLFLAPSIWLGWLAETLLAFAG
jgi:leader peptidase (prepilin peptidase)/N-methyltransferase